MTMQERYSFQRGKQQNKWQALEGEPIDNLIAARKRIAEMIKEKELQAALIESIGSEIAAAAAQELQKAIKI